MDKKVTIVMSAYNHEEYVEQTIKSVLNQTYKDYKFVVADDASTDHTVDILMKYEDKIDEIHLFDVNSGGGRGRELILNSDTKYTARINSDDTWAPQKLEKQVAYMEEHPECGACFTLCNEVDETGKLIDIQVFRANNQTKEEWMYTFWRRGNCLAHPSILIRTELYQELCKENNGVFRQLPDLYMWMRLIQKWEIHIIQENLVQFCHHEKNRNVSACTAVNCFRSDMEAEYIWYKTMKAMDTEYFKKAFKRVMMNPDASSDEEILCEKYFVLCISPVMPIQSAAALYYYDVFENAEKYNVLCEKYAYHNREFYQQEMQIGKGKFQVELFEQNNELRGILQKVAEKNKNISH